MRRLVLVLFLASIPTTASASDDSSGANESIAELGVSGGVRGWQTPYRNSSAGFSYGLMGGFMPRPWLQLGASLEHSRRTSTPEDLRITNTETWLTLGPRFSAWVDFVRLFAEVGIAGVVRTVSYRDEDLPSPVRLAPGFGGGGGFTIAIADRIGVTMRGGWRRRDNQSNLLATLDVSWLFPSAQRQQ